jgi:hypothetical protein
MTPLLQPFIEELKKTSRFLQIISGFVMTAVPFVLYTQNISPYLSRICIAIGGTIILWNILSVVIKARKIIFGESVPVYQRPFVRIATLAKPAIIYICLLFSGWTIFKWATYSPCETFSNDFTVLVSSFGSDEEGFSMRLFNQVTDEISLTKIDTIMTRHQPNHFKPFSRRTFDSLSSHLNKSCIYDGIWVFGNRYTTSANFDCHIYQCNIPDSVNKNLIYIQNPDLINFSIDSQADFISNFIMGLILGRTDTENSRSREYFRKAMELNKNKKNEKSLAYCHFFIGNSYLKEQNFSLAEKEFGLGIKKDSLNADLRYNLAYSLHALGDTSKALLAFEQASKLKPDLEMPKYAKNILVNSIEYTIKNITSTTKFSSVRLNSKGFFDVVDDSGKIILPSYFKEAYEHSTIPYSYTTVVGETINGTTEIWIQSNQKEVKLYAPISIKHNEALSAASLYFNRYIAPDENKR